MFEMPANMLRTGILCIIKIVSILNEGFYSLVADLCTAIEDMFRDEKARMSESSDNLKMSLKEPSDSDSNVANEVTMAREEFEELLHDLNDKLTEIFNCLQRITSGIKSRTRLGRSASTENEEARSCSYKPKKNCSPKTNEEKSCTFIDKKRMSKPVAQQSTQQIAHESESKIQSKYNFDDTRNKAGPITTSNQNLFSSTGLQNRENVVECKVFEMRSSSSEESDSCSRSRKEPSYRISSKMPIVNGMIPNRFETQTESGCGFDDERSLDCQEVSGDVSEMRVKIN